MTAWIPLVDVDESLGCMGYVPGSHAVGLRRFVNIFFGEMEDVLARPEHLPPTPTSRIAPNSIGARAWPPSAIG